MSYTFLDYFLTCFASREHLLLDVSGCPGRLRQVCNMISSATNSICEIHVIRPKSTIDRLHRFLITPPNPKKKSANLDLSLVNARRRIAHRSRTNSLSTTLVPFRKQLSLGKELAVRKKLSKPHERSSSTQSGVNFRRFVHGSNSAGSGEMKAPFSERMVVILHKLELASKEYQSSLLELLTTRKMEINGKLYHLAPWFIFVVSISQSLGKIRFLLPRLRSRFLLQIIMEKNTEIGDAQHVKYSTQEISTIFNNVERVYMDMSIEQYIRSIIMNCRHHIAVHTFPTPTAFSVFVSAVKGLAIVKEDLKKRSFGSLGQRSGINPKRVFVVPEYVQRLLPLVFGHRITLKTLVSEKLNLGTNHEFLVHVIRNVPPPV